MNSLKNISLGIALLVIWVLPRAGTSATVLALSLEDLTGRADIIVRGVATGIETHRDSRGAIVRSVSYRVGDYIKGDGNKKITIRLHGGELDGIGRLVPGEVDLEIGEETILFLKKTKSQKNFNRIVGLSQGRFHVIKDPGTKDLFVSRPIGNLNLVGTPENDSHGLGQNKTPVRMKLSEFVAAVKKFCSD